MKKFISLMLVLISCSVAAEKTCSDHEGRMVCVEKFSDREVNSVYTANSSELSIQRIKFFDGSIEDIYYDKGKIRERKKYIGYGDYSYNMFYDDRIQRPRGIPLNARYVTVYKRWIIRSQIDGFLEGSYAEYGSDGFVYLDLKFVKGKIQGRIKEYDENKVVLFFAEIDKDYKVNTIINKTLYSPISYVEYLEKNKK